MAFPYIKNASEIVASATNKKEFLVGFGCLNKLYKLIKRHKDKISTDSGNNAVYRINCNDCDATYVGQTKRKLKTRILEHRRNILLDDSKHSVVTNHILESSHTLDWEHATILDSEPNYHKRFVSEMIYIEAQKNSLNSNKDTEMLDESYFSLLDRIVEEF
ncbi:PREDICTED: uncharacterized protein LOC105449705 [Wasmannia auropunctata]|uniref:uncharacterized protein LOC105449705 n=1 Tax=Wasmannia auropunctata TaxID=64793 RepID=UPI0005EDE462|nr:PREDICTED: uncharacterized protein LOC105449705 [Wasmannia auropunctata]